jgi:hypothetical protein
MNECTCKKGHKDQIVRFPKGAEVITTTDIKGVRLIKAGTAGVISLHCADGRACVMIDGESHTFHFPEDFIALKHTPNFMPKETQKDLATPRPWRYASPKYSWPSIISEIPNGKLPFTNIVKTDCSISHGGSTSFEAATANAALIVKAVNEHEALCAVAEATRNFINILGHLSDDVQEEREAVKSALAALNQLRNK